MPQTGNRGSRFREVAGGERRSQEAANETRRAGAVDMDFNDEVPLDPSQVEFRRPEPSKDLGPWWNTRNQQFTPGDPELQDVEFADEQGEGDVIPSYANEDEEFLFGMTDRPNEPMLDGVTGGRPVPPKDVHTYLGALAEASADPNAPPELFTFMRILQELLSE